MKSSLLTIGVAGLLGACTATYPPKDLSTQRRIDETLQQAAQPKAAAPVTVPPAVSESLLPPLRSTLPRTAARPNEPRFDLMVTDAPIAQILHSIVADTRYSIVLSPKVAAPASPVGQGQSDAAAQAAAANASRRELLTVHLKNVTVFEALDALRESYGYEYSVQGTRIFVEPPEMQTRFYQINYTLGQRRGVSDLQVVAGATMGSGGSSGSSNGSSSSGNSSSSGSSGGSTSYASNQASALSTMAKSDLWGEIEDSMRTILGCFIPRQQASVARAGGQGGGSSATGTSSRADVSYVGDSQLGERARGVEGCAEGRAVNVNQMSGTVLVRGMPKELRTIERLLRTMQLTIDRQVGIEAKVIDVQLNRDSQQGINWAAFHQGLLRGSVGADPSLVGANGTPSAGQIRPAASLADLFGGQLVGGATQTAFSAGLGVILRGADFAALISFLETQGDVHVLSSPRIATLNNQKAVIKVGTEEPFVTSIAPGSTSLNTGASVSVPPTLNYAPFFSGISLDVTPQIDDQDRVTLHVHALVNSIVEKEKPSSTQVGSIPVPLAVNSVNETDSVVKTVDGTMVVIGGLMTESNETGRSAIPGVGDVPVAGALFRKGSQSWSKRELVILIKPSIVRSGAEWAEDIAATGRRIHDMNEMAQRPSQD
jgi:MSHA biogenesis protein MshL